MRAQRRQRRIEGTERGRYQRLAREIAGIRHQIACREVVGAVEHQIIRTDQRHRIARRQPFAVTDEVHMRIERMDSRGGAIDFQRADIRRRMDDLALQIGQRHLVIVHDAQRADTGRSKIHQRGGTEPTGADHQHLRSAQLRLAGATDLAQHDVARIALEFIAAQHCLSVISAVIASVAKQSSSSSWLSGLLRRYAPRNDDCRP